jgi:two-component system cell cycle sensor histidine kinase/response regulator CckA
VTQAGSPSGPALEDEIPALIRTLLATERRLEELTGGEVDSVMDGDGRQVVLRRAQEQLRDNEAVKQTSILDALPAHIALLDARGRIVSVNESWRRFAVANGGGAATQMVDVDYLAVCDIAEGQGWGEAAEAGRGIRGVLTGTLSGFSLEYGCHSPSVERWFLLTVTPLAGSPPRGAVVMHLDVSGRKAAEMRLADSEEEYRLLFDANPHAMWVFDAETLAFLAVNDAAVRVYGFSREEFLAMTIRDIRPSEDVPALVEYVPTMADARGLRAIHVRHRKKDGTSLEVDGVTSPIVFRGRRARLVLATDVSEKKRLEAQLLQAQKMDAVGRLAGGIAHDFNNSLGVILGYTELLLRHAAESQRDKLSQILKATQRAAALTRQLLAFSRKQVVDPKVLDPNALLLDLEPMLHRLIGEDVQLTVASGAASCYVSADPGQLEQVVINLCVNARDAMPVGGRLRIDTSNVRVADAEAGAEPMRGGDYARIAVSDSGSGMGKETLDRIFEPFFTTKDLGKGTGLGLAMVYGIVKQSGGYVFVESEVGRGTTFKIYLPRVDAPLQALLHEAADAVAAGSETILLVEDEDALREITAEILRENGYQVLDARDPEEAIARARKWAEAIDLLVTDVVMPGMSGRAMAAMLLADRPTLRVLYISGYTDDVIAPHGVLQQGTLLLEKPFAASALLARVREALGAQDPEVAHA